MGLGSSIGHSGADEGGFGFESAAGGERGLGGLIGTSAEEGVASLRGGTAWRRRRKGEGDGGGVAGGGPEEEGGWWGAVGVAGRGGWSEGRHC